ncbi:hypothetical protein [Aliihoeflea sp. 2WW]|uniref:helix-turn-helix transcriptional regulator n=1 Tax=Aliihoeflea sp. 2WW TaxID=1381123 RepID=UPI000550ABBF|nr:hypothetical protein [Aliihoeflea sp. 2WW]
MDQHERTYLRFQLSQRTGRRHLFRGKWMTVKEIAKITGMGETTVYARINSGKPLEGPVRIGVAPRRYEFRGQQLTINEIAHLAGISQTTAYSRVCGNRVLEGDDLADPFAKPDPRHWRLTFRGITDTLAGWQRRTGIPRQTIAERVDLLGWTIERALTERPMNGGQRVRLHRNRRIIDHIATITRRGRNAQIVRKIAESLHLQRRFQLERST